MISNLDKKIQDFQRRYQAYVKKSHKHMKRPILSKLSGDIDYDEIFFQVEDIPMMEIDLPEEMFRVLVHMEDKLENWKFDDRLQGSTYVDYIKHLYEKEFRETKIREQHPAVNKAYQQYLILLTLADRGV